MTMAKPDNVICATCRSCRLYTDLAYRNVGGYLKNLQGSQSLRD